MKHPTAVSGYDGDLNDLACDLCDLRYDKLATFLRHLSDVLICDACEDHQNDRKLLSQQLNFASDLIGLASGSIAQAWTICKPRMEPTDD